MIGGRPVIARALEPFCGHADISAVQPVLNPDDTAMFREAAGDLRYEAPVNGGATRQASVRAGLEALAAHAPDIVLIHDAARPFVTPALISRAIAAVAAEHPGATVLVSSGLAHGYGMAGARIGALGGDPALVRACLQVKIAAVRLNTNRVAQVGAAAALRDEEWLRRGEAVIRRNLAALNFAGLPSITRVAS